jgi:hypothetical protein
MIKFNTLVLDQYGNSGRISKCFDDFSACAMSARTMTGEEWLAAQEIPFSAEQLEEVWYSVELEVGGSIWSPESSLTLL